MIKPADPTTVVTLTGYGSRKIHRAAPMHGGLAWRFVCGATGHNRNVIDLGQFVIDADQRNLCKSCFNMKYKVSISYNSREIY